MSDLRELVEELEKEAQNVEDRSDSNLGEGYENGVCSGIRHAKDALEATLDERSTPVKELTATLSLDTDEFEEDVQEVKAELEGLSEQADSVAESLEEIEPPRTNARVYEPYGARNGGITDD